MFSRKPTAALIWLGSYSQIENKHQTVQNSLFNPTILQFDCITILFIMSKYHLTLKKKEHDFGMLLRFFLNQILPKSVCLVVL